MKMLEEEGDEGRLENSKLSCFWRYCDWFNGNYLCIYLSIPFPPGVNTASVSGYLILISKIHVNARCECIKN